MNKFLCVHGHFYQPPRENPWTEEIDPEDSAFPFHDWNERIFYECYGPNAASPILGTESRIESMVNNYAHISFNFGPTLMDWMEQHKPKIYSQILEADRLSRRRYSGHGSALAQIYNHLIMPLAGRQDKKIQIAWGIADFEFRFGRRPEGMWLPETAVDEETLELLAEYGIKFTLLAPHQAAKVRPLGSDHWQEVSSEHLDSSQPYRWLASSGKPLDIFFYHSRLSHAVAFEKMLSSGYEFAHRLATSFKKHPHTPQLLSLATDGESYGHHFRFGDMALAFAMKHLERDPEVHLTNFGEYLEKFPPHWEVQIHPNTSWSCSHGVKRWKEDCGCKSGSHPDWHQKWRKPLRESLNALRDSLDSIYQSQAPLYFKNPAEALEQYIELILNPSAHLIHRFLGRHGLRHLSSHEVYAAIRLLEMQRHKQLMFTSCGWFFDDVSGIETVQILKYAARAIELSSSPRELEESFLNSLKECPSNVPECKDGAQVYLKLAKPSQTGPERAAAHFSLLESLKERALSKPIRIFEIEFEKSEKIENKEVQLHLYTLALKHKRTLEQGVWSTAVLQRGKVELECWVRPYAARQDPGRLGEEIQKALEGGADAASALIGKDFGPLHFKLEALLPDDYRRVVKSMTLKQTPSSESLYQSWKEEIEKMLQSRKVSPRLWEIFESARTLGLEARSLPMSELLSQRLFDLMAQILLKPEKEAIAQVEDWLEKMEKFKIQPSLWEVQNFYWQWMERWPEVLKENGTKKLGEKLNFKW